MALDHYVSQVHLRKFYAHDLNRLLHAVRKRDGFYFTPNARSICRIDEGNTNRYLNEPRAIEDFLTTIEPNYDRALRAFAIREPTREDLYVIAGFIAYVLTCTPATLRLESYPMARMIEQVGSALDSAGEFPEMPSSLGSTFEEAIQSGRLTVSVDQMYPHAIGVSQIYSRLSTFGNSDWVVLTNNTDRPFMSSDFPVAYGPETVGPFQYRTFPLSPTLAVRIRSREDSRVSDEEFQFPNNRMFFGTLGRNEVGVVNQSIVRCAESTVYSSTMDDSLRRFISKNSNFRIEPSHARVGPYQMFGSGIQPHVWPAPE